MGCTSSDSNQTIQPIDTDSKNYQSPPKQDQKIAQLTRTPNKNTNSKSALDFDNSPKKISIKNKQSQVKVSNSPNSSKSNLKSPSTFLRGNKMRTQEKMDENPELTHIQIDAIIKSKKDKMNRQRQQTQSSYQE